MFVDRARAKLSAGKGGHGVVAWRREKYIPKGGPCGGDGGRGGSVLFEVDAQLHALDWFRRRRHLRAENGVQGGAGLRQGRRGKDLILKVPCGTLVKDAQSGALLKDLLLDKERFLICRGGAGGKGNTHFKSPTRRAPNFCTSGKAGEEAEVELELKLVADVGLVGFPNAGKSTLISQLAGVKAKAAPYPFTTLTPNIGFVEKEDYSRLSIADIPGIIRGAHAGRGLGFEFLRHIDRTELLLFILDASGSEGRTPLEDYFILQEELAYHASAKKDRPCFVALNKADVPESKEFIAHFLKEAPLPRDHLFVVSALTGEGLDGLVKKLTQKV